MQELRRRILSSVREHHRCTFLTAFTIAFVVRELHQCVLLSLRELRQCVLLSLRELRRRILLTAFITTFVPQP